MMKKLSGTRRSQPVQKEAVASHACQVPGSSGRENEAAAQYAKTHERQKSSAYMRRGHAYAHFYLQTGDSVGAEDLRQAESLAREGHSASYRR